MTANADILNTVQCGDCLDVLDSVKPGLVDLTIIDPPYTGDNKANGGNRYKQSEFLTKFDDMSSRVFKRFMRDRLLKIFDVSRVGAHVYIFVGWRMLREMMDTVEEGSLRINKVLVWNQMSIGGGYAWRNQHDHIIFASKGMPDSVRDRSLGTVLPAKRVSGAKRRHPFQKPVSLLEKLVHNASDPGQLVLDAFAGSGSTLEAAANLGRNYLGIDVSPKYCAEIRTHLAQLKSTQECAAAETAS